MANTIRQGFSGQTIEQQGSLDVREGIRVWDGTEFVTVASSEDILSSTPIVESYADMVTLIQEVIANGAKKGYQILVSFDENKQQPYTTYNFYPNSVIPEDSITQWVASVIEPI